MPRHAAVTKKLLAVAIALVGAYLAYEHSSTDAPQLPAPEIADAQLARAFDDKRTAFQTGGSGTVTRVLPDDTDGSRHQRFILRLESGQTLMVAHNIDLAPRVAALKAGDTVSFFGEYEWNSRGGVIHWTHRDPQAQHVAGWLEHYGRRYQ